MNARAAWRLEAFAFPRVLRYAPGKADWKAAGLPTEGTRRPLRAIDVVRRNPPTCRPTDPVTKAVRAAQERDWPTLCMVVNEAGGVLGRLRRDGLDSASSAPVLEVMEEGPTTIRADEDLVSLVERMKRRKVASIVVTDPDGRLIGIVYRDDAEKALGTGRVDREET